MMTNNESLHELLGYERIKIIQKDEMFSFSLDSMLLAYFCDVTKAKRIIDLGTGNGPIPLFLTLKTDAKIIGVEIQNDVADLAQRSVKLNNLDKQIEIINADFKGIYKVLCPNSFDVVLSNPPYFKVKEDSIINKNDYLTIARHEVKASIYDVICEANKLLIAGGKLCFIHRVSRLPEIFRALEDNNFGIKRIKLIYPKVSKGAVMFLCEARKNKKSDLKIDKEIIVCDENDNYTDEVLRIFNFKKN